MLHELLREIVREFRDLDRSSARLRKFGLLVGGIFVLLALLAMWHSLPAYAYAAALIGTLLVLCALIAPVALDTPYRAWMILALILGLVVGNIVLVALYLAVLTPIGLLQRLFGGDALNRRYDADAPTYWIPRTPSPREHMRRPF